MREISVGDMVTLDRSVADNIVKHVFLVVEKRATKVAASTLKYPFYYIFSPETGTIGPFQRGELDDFAELAPASQAIE